MKTIGRLEAVFLNQPTFTIREKKKSFDIKDTAFFFVLLFCSLLAEEF